MTLASLAVTCERTPSAFPAAAACIHITLLIMLSAHVEQKKNKQSLKCFRNVLASFALKHFKNILATFILFLLYMCGRLEQK